MNVGGTGLAQVLPRRRRTESFGRHRLVRVIIAAGVALVALWSNAPAVAEGRTFAAKAVAADYRTLRYQRVIGQTDWHTCGPAAIATWLHYYFELETSEQEMLELALTASEDEQRVLTHGLSAAALKDAVQSKGVPVQGYRLTINNLIDYFDRGGLPVILHVTEPRNHFVVAIGIVADRFVVADPSWGQRLMSFASLETEKAFSGVVLVSLPSEQQAIRVQRNQGEALNEALRHLSRLATLRRRLQ